LIIEQTHPDAPSVWPIYPTIQRDDMIPGFRGGGRQSRFADSLYQNHDPSGRVLAGDRPDKPSQIPYIRRSGTLNSLATARDTVVVGGCYADTLDSGSRIGVESTSEAAPSLAR
jgi:hypothetical protein